MHNSHRLQISGAQCDVLLSGGDKNSVNVYKQCCNSLFWLVKTDWTQIVWGKSRYVNKLSVASGDYILQMH